MRSSCLRSLLVPACVAAALLAGCATPRAPVPQASLPWHDAAFAYDPALVTVTAESLFALDPQTLNSVRARPAVRQGNAGARTADLLELVFGPELRAFAYAGGHSTAAAETWHNRRGDCLSLSVLTLALARALDLPAQIQEVQVPPLIDRRGNVDFLNQHVNVLVRTDRDVRAVGRVLPAGALVVDFEPQPGTRVRGRALADHEVLARFLNNRAAEHLAAGDERRAYAHFRAAIGADPAFGPAYGNLAQLYLRVGLEVDAEGLLRTALAYDDGADFALAALHRLLLAQGRVDEAQQFQAALAARRERDPHYWLALGLQRLQDRRWTDAVAALERAQALTSGFDEVHQYLAIAYWRAGKPLLARDQLAILSALGRSEAQVAKLSRKFDSAVESARVQ
jgi:tetratricopeptide (TPR) repeat protein